MVEPPPYSAPSSAQAEDVGIPSRSQMVAKEAPLMPSVVAAKEAPWADSDQGFVPPPPPVNDGFQQEEPLPSPVSPPKVASPRPAPEEMPRYTPPAPPPAPAPAPASPPGDKIITIVLKKTSEERRLGISVDATNRTSLLIASVDGGMMAAWNRNNPGLQVEANDSIVGVNGRSGDAMELTEECKKADVLEMQVAKGS